MTFLDNKKLKEIQSRVTEYLQKGIVKTKQSKEYIDFFIDNSNDSLDSASVLYSLSTNKDLLTKIGRSELNGFLWVINASYYSMFYIARALITNKGIKINSDLSVHMITYDVLVHFFYQNNKLQKKIIEDYLSVKEEVDVLLGKEKADELIKGYFYEKNKRTSFTYETGTKVVKSKAKTSLERAKLFNQEIRKLLKKVNTP